MFDVWIELNNFIPLISFLIIKITFLKVCSCEYNFFMALNKLNVALHPYFISYAHIREYANNSHPPLDHTSFDYIINLDVTGNSSWCKKNKHVFIVFANLQL